MRAFGWIAVIYLGVAGATQLFSGVSDMNVQLPDLGGSLLGQSGVTATGIDLAMAAGLWFLVLR